MEERQDLISRQAAIDALGERPAVWMDSDYEIAQRNQYDMDKLAIETVPSVTPKMRWIPCHPSKLPKNMPLWATFDGDGYRYVEKVFWDMTEWNRDVSKVIAYMPYEEPEPYMEEGGK